jgi:hypothetical protein
MPASVVSMDSDLHALYAQTQAARNRSRHLAGRLQAVQNEIQETLQLIQAARSRTEQIYKVWLAVYAAPPERLL